MGRIYFPFLRGGIVLALILSGFSGIARSAEYVNKKYRNLFLSDDLQKNYYKIEVQTIKFFDRQYSDVNGLVESFRGTSSYAYDLFTRAFCYGRGGVLDTQSFTYDGAIAILSYLIAGQTQRASDMLKTYRKEFYYVKNDLIGLYNSYRTDIAPNRYGGLSLGIDGDRMHLGPTMWVGLAALQYTAMTGDLQFLSFTIDMVKWARSLNHYTFPDGKKGGVCMGTGWGPDWSQIYSAENNTDYYAVLNMLCKIYDSGDERVKNIFHRKSFGREDMEEEMTGVKRWFMEVLYDKSKNCFYCGFNERGADKTPALDNVSWVITGFGPATLKEMGVDPFKLIEYAERNFLVNSVMEEMPIRGFDLTNTIGRRRTLRMVWFEGTGFQTVAYQVMASYAREIGDREKAEEYREKAAEMSGEMEKAAQQVKMKGSLPYTSRRPAEKEIVLTFADEWEIPRGNKGQWVSSASSTGWRYLALAGFNPMDFDTRNVSYKYFK